MGEESSTQHISTRLSRGYAIVYTYAYLLTCISSRLILSVHREGGKRCEFHFHRQYCRHLLCCCSSLRPLGTGSIYTHHTVHEGAKAPSLPVRFVESVAGTLSITSWGGPSSAKPVCTDYRTRMGAISVPH